MFGRSLNSIPSPPASPQPLEMSPDNRAKLTSGKPPGVRTALLTGVNGWPDCAETTPFNAQLPSKILAGLTPGVGNSQAKLSAKRCRRSNEEFPRSPLRGSEALWGNGVDISKGSPMLKGLLIERKKAEVSACCRTPGPKISLALSVMWLQV